MPLSDRNKYLARLAARPDALRYCRIPLQRFKVKVTPPGMATAVEVIYQGVYRRVGAQQRPRRNFERFTLRGEAP